MNRNTIRLTLGTSVLTVLFLAGGIYLYLSQVFPWLNRVRPHDLILFPLLSLAIVTLVSGAFWGAGLAWLTNSNLRSMALQGAIHWFLSAFIGALVVGLISIPLTALGREFSINLHLIFTIDFVVCVAIATAWSAWKMAVRIGLGSSSSKRVGLYSGLAAGLGFLVASLVLQLVFGWEVGRPVFRQYNMLTITYICTAVAALAGGLAMGWMLSKDTEHTTSISTHQT